MRGCSGRGSPSSSTSARTTRTRCDFARPGEGPGAAAAASWRRHRARGPGDGRRLPGRAGAGGGRRDRAARRLLPAGAGDPGPSRRAPDRRRDHHRLRPDGGVVRADALERPARHPHLREGRHQRVPAARRHDGQRGDRPRDPRGARLGAVGPLVDLRRTSRLCAVALRTLDILERDQLVPRAARLGRYLLDRLRALEDLDCVGEVRGLGLMAAVEVVADRGTKRPLLRTSAWARGSCGMPRRRASCCGRGPRW